MSDWPHVELKQIATPKGIAGGPFGSKLGGRDYIGSGVPVIRGVNLSHGKYLGGDYVYVSAEKVARDLNSNLASPGDLIFTQRGTLGQLAIVPAAGPEMYVVSQSQMRLTVDDSVACPVYVFYAASTAHFLRQIDESAIATGVPHINLGILQRLTIPLPTLCEQRALAEVLGALDEKIAANTTLISAADRLAAASFAALPKDEILPLSSVAQFVNGKAFTKGATGTGRVVVRIAELNSGIGGSTVYNDVNVPDQHVAHAGDILFAWSGSLMLHRWHRDEAIVNQHIFKVIPHEGRPHWLVWGLIANKLEKFRAIAADKATTMGHIQRRHLDEPVRVPTNQVVAKNHAKMTALWERALTAENENIALAATREALLSGFMSGRLHASETETPHLKEVL